MPRDPQRSIRTIDLLPARAALPGRFPDRRAAPRSPAPPEFHGFDAFRPVTGSGTSPHPHRGSQFSLFFYVIALSWRYNNRHWYRAERIGSSFSGTFSPERRFERLQATILDIWE